MKFFNVQGSIRKHMNYFFPNYIVDTMGVYEVALSIVAL